MSIENLGSVPRPVPRPPDLNTRSPLAPPESPRPQPRPPHLGGGDRSTAQPRPADNLTGQVSFPEPGSPAQGVARPGDPTVEQMAEAIRNYPGSRATTVDASVEIAQAAQAAAAQFGVDPRALLAVWARESQFDPARSEGNGKGLGQLTNDAVDELQRIGAGGRNGHRARVSRETFAMLRTPEARAAFERLGSHNNRLTVTDNAIGSAAYLRLMIDVNNGNRNESLKDYNGARPAIRNAYPGHIREAYQTLFGSPMPARLEMR